jgi:transketolase
VLIAVGPLAGTYLAAFEGLKPEVRPNLWALAELPLEQNPMPAELLKQISEAPALGVVEEHVRRGSFGSELVLFLAEHGVLLRRFVHLHAREHHYSRYGSQAFLRRLSGLDVDSVLSALFGTR